MRSVLRRGLQAVLFASGAALALMIAAAPAGAASSRARPHITSMSIRCPEPNACTITIVGSNFGKAGRHHGSLALYLNDRRHHYPRLEHLRSNDPSVSTWSSTKIVVNGKKAFFYHPPKGYVVVISNGKESARRVLIPSVFGPIATQDSGPSPGLLDALPRVMGGVAILIVAGWCGLALLFLGVRLLWPPANRFAC